MSRRLEMAESELYEPIEFIKVDKISDDVYAIGPNVALKFSVSLSRISNGKRYHFHKEYEYPSKLPDCPAFVTIKRSYDYYLSIENIQKDEHGNKLFIRIGPQEYMLFKKGLEEAISWFTDSKYSNLFVRDRGKLIITSPSPDFVIRNLPMNKYIQFLPVILNHGMSNDDQEPGIRMILGDSNTYIDVNLDRFMGLYYIVSCFNMYQSASTMVNYLERPEFGTNRYVVESTPSYREKILSEKSKSGADGVTGRTIPLKNSKNNISALGG